MNKIPTSLTTIPLSSVLLHTSPWSGVHPVTLGAFVSSAAHRNSSWIVLALVVGTDLHVVVPPGSDLIIVVIYSIVAPVITV